MCDFIPGEVIIAHHKDDSAGAAVIQQIREVGSPHFEFGGSLEDRLLQSEIPIRKNLQSKFYLVRVPAGNEAFKAEIFRFWYLHQVFSPEFWQGVKELPEFLRDSRLAFSVVPNSVLTGCFTFSQPHYQNYKRMFDWPGFSSTTKTVCVVDSGIESVSGFNVVSKHNFVDWTKRRDVTDEHPLQHGTAIAGIIRDMCPNSPLVIHKVLDKNNRASEWDTLAALAVNSGADIVNMSLSFGLQDQRCGYCGRESRSSRSAVFEKMISDICADDVVVVSAAGNQSKPELSFPARFANVVAIEAVNGSGALASFTNHAAVDQEGNRHERVFVLPGGDQDLKTQVAVEAVGSSPGGLLFGTSFAAAYASGLIAHVWGTRYPGGATAAEVISGLATIADKNLPGYNFPEFGHGLMRA